MGNYEPFDGTSIPAESIDLVTNSIGFHHAPEEKRARFIQAVWQVLKPGGLLVVRDHDVDGPEMDAFVALAHDVFNAGLNISWADNAAQIRNFTSASQLEIVLGSAGFEKSKARLLQDHDPTRNTLMVFVKPPLRAL
ncbi:MAG: class I SAM-dependent methyltransferase [Spirochaetia bacterium]|nr:class I SAM-dependent methyltransferase [Spirochaetia bacterium]